MACATPWGQVKPNQGATQMNQADPSGGMVLNHEAALVHPLCMAVYIVPDDGSTCHDGAVAWRTLVDPMWRRDLRVSDDDGASLMSLLRQHASRAKALIITVVSMDAAAPNRVPAPVNGGELGALAQPATRSWADAPADVPADTLTAREAEILTHISWGQSAAQVAMRMGLSQHTVSTHLRNCYAKLKVRNRLQAVHRARELGHIA
ncbi:MAG: LuxR C-terminal-related transcriptional regulator [Pseudomonadota bacterium]